MVFGLDHLVTEQEDAPEEIEALCDFLKRAGTNLILRRITTFRRHR